MFRTQLTLAIAAALSLIGASVVARGGTVHHTSSGHSKSHLGSHSGTHTNSDTGAKSGDNDGEKSSHHSSGTKSRENVSHSGPRASPGVKRDPDGEIHRSVVAKDDFKKGHPCPSTGKSSGACPGYIVDHVHPLKRGGADSPSNMQWQTTAAAKAKDKTE